MSAPVLVVIVTEESRGTQIASHCPISMSFPSTTTTAWPERQISPVSRFPVEKDSADFDEFSTMRPYARWRMELFSGVTETCRPACALVLRKTIFSTAACCCAVMETPSLERFGAIQSARHTHSQDSLRTIRTASPGVKS